jgi:hypothetical protein
MPGLVGRFPREVSEHSYLDSKRGAGLGSPPLANDRRGERRPKLLPRQGGETDQAAGFGTSSPDFRLDLEGVKGLGQPRLSSFKRHMVDDAVWIGDERRRKRRAQGHLGRWP